MRMQFRTKIVLYFLLLIIPLMFTLYFLQSYFIKKYYKNSSAVLVNTIKDSIILQNYNNILLNDYFELRKNLEKVFSTGQFNYILFWNDSKKPIFYKTDKEIDLKSFLNFRYQKNLPSNHEFFSELRIPDTTKTLAYLTIGIKMDKMQSDLAELKINILIGAVIILLLFFAISVFISKALSKPIHKLVESMDLVSLKNPKKLELQIHTNIIEIDRLVTKFNEMIAKLDFLSVELERTSKQAAIGQTTAMLAHDVRKPFSKLKIILENFENFKKDSKNLETARIDIEKSIKNVESMIADIMDYSREVKLEVHPMPIVNILDFSIRQTAQSYAPACAGRDANISFEYNIQNKFMPLVDDERLARVFGNIIGNAIEAITQIGKKDHGIITVETRDICRGDPCLRRQGSPLRGNHNFQ